MSALPAGWECVRIIDIGELRYGKGLPTNHLSREGYPVFGANGIIGFHTQYMYEDEQLLISCRGANSGAINMSPKQCFVTNNSLVLELDKEAQASRLFLKYALIAADRSRMVTGSAQPQVTIANAEGFELPFSPLAEQGRIVAKIDSLTSKSKRARDHLKHIPRLVEKYRHAALAFAFSAQERTNWKKGKLGDFAAEALIGLVRDKSEQSDVSGHPYIRMNHYDLDGRWNDDKLTFVEATKQEIGRYELRGGDVIFNTRNSFELVGKVALWPSDRPGHLYNNNLLRIRFNKSVVPRFAALWMMSEPFRTYLQTQKSATTSVCAIYQRSIMAAPFILPSIEEQNAIVSKIDSAFAWIDRLAADATSARKLIDHLDQAVLAKAFRGELVPQDPADEPASVLLRRIRAERAAAPKPKRGRGKAA